MGPLTTAATILLTIFIIVYAATRGSPSPWAPSTPCQLNSDCSHPDTCDTATSTCVDLVLPGLIAAAQATIKSLYDAIQSIIENYTNVYAAHVKTLVATATAMGLVVPTDNITAIATSLAGGISILNKYKFATLVSSSTCDPTNSSQCGYYTQIMALSPTTPKITIWTTAMNSPAVSAEVQAVFDAFSPLTATLGNLNDSVTTSAQAKNIPLNSDTQVAINVLTDDVSQINGYSSSLTALATAANQAGLTLYHHFV